MRGGQDGSRWHPRGAFKKSKMQDFVLPLEPSALLRFQLMEKPSHTKELRARFGMKWRESAPTEQVVPALMGNLLGTIEQAEESARARASAGEPISWRGDAP